MNLKMSIQIAVIFYVISEDTRAQFDTIFFFLKVIVSFWRCEIVNTGNY